VACNTATTNAIQELRAKYNVPLGIEPAIKPAVTHLKNADYRNLSDTRNAE
jgi:glutamate racemase